MKDTELKINKNTKKEKTEQFVSDLSYTEELNLFQWINDFVVFYINVNFIAIENFVIGFYFAIYNDEIAMKLYLVLQERDALFVIVVIIGPKHHRIIE